MPFQLGELGAYMKRYLSARYLHTLCRPIYRPTSYMLRHLQPPTPRRSVFTRGALGSKMACPSLHPVVQPSGSNLNNT